MDEAVDVADVVVVGRLSWASGRKDWSFLSSLYSLGARELGDN